MSETTIIRSFARILADDQAGAGYNAVLEWNPEAPLVANALDKERSERGPRSPLHGLPVLLKDNIDTDDGTHTSAGSLALGDRFALEDAEVVSRLRAAGAVICGKTNMTELANFITEGMPNGYSSRGGKVRDYWELEGDPSGSSSGSAVAVAAGYVDLALGTETCGSIISPAMRAGIVGLRPTPGRLSSRGVIPISPTCDAVGPMTRSVRLAAQAFEVLGGSSAPKAPSLRWGLVLPDSESDTGVEVALERLVDQLRTQGIELVPFEAPSLEEEALTTVLVHEFQTAFDAALRRDRQEIRSLRAVADYNLRHSDTCLRYGQTWVEKSLALEHPLTSAEYGKAWTRLASVRAETVAMMDRLGVGVVLTSGHVFAFAGTACPALTLPLARGAGGLPIPAVLYARPYDEEVLLEAGIVIESLAGFDQARRQ